MSLLHVYLTRRLTWQKNTKLLSSTTAAALAHLTGACNALPGGGAARRHCPLLNVYPGKTAPNCDPLQQLQHVLACSPCWCLQCCPRERGSLRALPASACPLCKHRPWLAVAWAGSAGTLRRVPGWRLAPGLLWWCRSIKVTGRKIRGSTVSKCDCKRTQ